jgi:DNA-directed RNA polymerase subunit alpha
LLIVQRPQIEIEEVSDNRSRFIVEPLEPGFGYTLGNTMRRTLLSRIPGAAITRIQIEGVEHEFSTIDGVVEDVVDIILNLKRIVVRFDDNEEQTIYLSAKGSGDVTAADLKLPAGVEVVNPDAHIATLGSSARLEMELTAAPGVGYRTADGNKGASSTIGVIPVDSIFSPVRKVAYRVENTQVGQMTNFDKLIIDIETNGAIQPKEARDRAWSWSTSSPTPPVPRTWTSPSRPSTSPSAPATAYAEPRSRPWASWWSALPTTCSTSPTSARRASTR